MSACDRSAAPSGQASVRTAIDQRRCGQVMLERYKVCCGLFHAFEGWIRRRRQRPCRTWCDRSRIRPRRAFLGTVKGSRSASDTSGAISATIHARLTVRRHPARQRTGGVEPALAHEARRLAAARTVVSSAAGRNEEHRGDYGCE